MKEHAGVAQWCSDLFIECRQEQILFSHMLLCSQTISKLIQLGKGYPDSLICSNPTLFGGDPFFEALRTVRSSKKRYVCLPAVS